MWKLDNVYSIINSRRCHLCFNTHKMKKNIPWFSNNFILNQTPYFPEKNLLYYIGKRLKHFTLEEKCLNFSISFSLHNQYNWKFLSQRKTIILSLILPFQSSCIYIFSFVLYAIEILSDSSFPVFWRAENLKGKYRENTKYIII